MYIYICISLSCCVNKSFWCHLIPNGADLKPVQDDVRFGFVSLRCRKRPAVWGFPGLG